MITPLGFNVILAYNKIAPIDFDSPGAGGATDYIDPEFGEIGFLYTIRKKKVVFQFVLSDPICICGKGFMDIDCDCEWDSLDQFEEVSFTKNQMEKVLKESLI